MKKMIWTLGIVFCIVVLVIGCSKKDNSRKENIEEQKYIKTFGEYCVSKQWIENKEHSTDDMFFYVKEGTEKQRQPDNINTVKKKVNVLKKQFNNKFLNNYQDIQM